MAQQNDLQRMFKVIKAIEHDGLDNTQYSTLEMSKYDRIDTTLYLGTIESRLLTNEWYYIFIWMDPYQWEDEEERGNYPKPDHVFHIYRDTPQNDQLVLIYKFNKQ